MPGLLEKFPFIPEDLIEVNKRIKNQRFRITINTRSTHGRYYVLTPNNLTLTDPKVEDHKGVEFYGPKSVKFGKRRRSIEVNIR